jgi:signal peptidase II
MEREAEPNPSSDPDTSAPLLSVGSPEAAPPPQAVAAPPAPLSAASPSVPLAPVSARDLPPAHPPSVLFLVVVTAISLAADLATKAWAKQTLSGDDPKVKVLRRITVLKDHVDFIFAENPGGAWSFLRSLPDTLRRPFFLIVSAAAIVFIVSIYHRIHPEQRAMKWGLPLALGGAMGNLVDRIRYGKVIDFVDVYISPRHHWPTFNVADIAIVVGVGLMAISMLSFRGSREADALKGGTTSAPIPPAA